MAPTVTPSAPRSTRRLARASGTLALWLFVVGGREAQPSPPAPVRLEPSPATHGLASDAQPSPGLRGKAAPALRFATAAPTAAASGLGLDLHQVCAERLAPGARGRRDLRVDLSAAHALVRLFSTDSAYAPSDAALAAALGIDGSLTGGGIGAALTAYAGALADVCAAPAGPAASIEPAAVAMLGRMAVVRPGSGPVNLPRDTELVAVDLRDLPATTGLAQILAAAVAPAMRTVPRLPKRWVRFHDGPVDEFFSPPGSPFTAYSTGLGTAASAALAATGARDLPIVLLLPDRIPPEAAAFAAGLRAAQRAWLAGASLPVAIAESEWRGIGDHGLAIRTSALADPMPVRESGWHAVAAQDDPFDPGNAHYRQQVRVDPEATTVEIVLAGDARSDLDLYLLHDANGDGAFDPFSELVGASISPTAQERISLGGPGLVPGDYEVWVHGFYVPLGRLPFALDVVQGRLLADEIPADLPLSALDPAAGGSSSREVLGRPPGPVSGPAERSFPTLVDPFGFWHPATQTRGDLRAALLAAHGVVRSFYRYFPVVGDTIDARLIETLESVDSHDGLDRVAAWWILRRFGEALHDGHQFVIPIAPLHATALPVLLEHVDGRPIVRRSSAPGVHPGDAILALDGRPIAEVYAEELARTSAATEGYKLDIADRHVYAMNGALSLTLQDADGAVREVTVAPQPAQDYYELFDRGVSDRPSGPLTDLGAPDIYYLNMNGFVLASNEQMRAAIAAAEAGGSKGMVLDMRDYPVVGHYEVAMRLNQQPFLSPVFRHNVFSGPATMSVSGTQFQLPPLSAPAYHEPIVLLTGPHAVSAAENFMLMIVGAARPLAIVGRQSAGTNGNISGVSLPGGFVFTYTGMEVLAPDGSPFHGIGIVPDVVVPVTVEDLRDGIDRDLLTAIRLLD